MIQLTRLTLFFLLFSLNCLVLKSQESQVASVQEAIVIDDVKIVGHKKTRERVIRRELPFSSGDTILLANLAQVLEEGERQLMNTGLFTGVNITYANWKGESQQVVLLVTVLETWYLYPVPIFELADRNFNVWWQEHNRSLQRVNIGMEFGHKNFTGWGDEIEAEFQYGYTRQYKLEYKLPYINKAGTLGFAGVVSYGRNREINYATEGNKQVFFRNDDEFLRQQFRLATGLSLRRKLYAQHNFDLGFFQNKVEKSVIEELNPEYFANGSNFQRYLRAAYSFSYDFRDIRAYPWKGYYVGASIEKEGLGVFDDRNALTINGRVEKYMPFGRRWSLGLIARGKYSLIRTPQAYNNNRALGFGQSQLRGFTFYVVDGLDLALLRSSLRFELWKGNITFGKWVFIEAFRELSMRVNLSLNNDIGIANAPFGDKELNPLNNRVLWGRSLGLDVVFYYDFVLRFEYSQNDLGEGGFFLDFELGF